MKKNILFLTLIFLAFCSTKNYIHASWSPDVKAQKSLDILKAVTIGTVTGIVHGQLLALGLDHAKPSWLIFTTVALAWPLISKDVSTNVTSKDNRKTVIRTTYLCNMLAALCTMYAAVKTLPIHRAPSLPVALFCSGIFPLLALCCYELPTVTNSEKVSP